MNDFSFSQRAQYTNFSLHENSSALKGYKPVCRAHQNLSLKCQYGRFKKILKSQNTR